MPCRRRIGSNSILGDLEWGQVLVRGIGLQDIIACTPNEDEPLRIIRKICVATKQVARGTIQNLSDAVPEGGIVEKDVVVRSVQQGDACPSSTKPFAPSFSSSATTKI